MITPATRAATVFGAVHLGYIVIETNSFADWRRFGRDAIGMHLDEVQSEAMRFRLDDNECRFLLQRGPAEDVVALGVATRRARHIRRDHQSGTPAQRAHHRRQRRGSGAARVERVARFPGPNGLAQEIFTGARHSATLPDMAVRGGFVTGENGIGHVAVTSKKPDLVHGYYGTVFDARLSDYIDETISGLKFKIRFLRVNQRHHSVAIAAVNRLPINPIRTRVQHLNIQVADLDDLTASYQRVEELGFQMALSVGQHTNDRELSYYAVTPSGFEWEVGWNPIVVDEETWEPATYQGISIWGHTPQGQRIIDKLAQFKAAGQSLLRREDTVPALSAAGAPSR